MLPRLTRCFIFLRWKILTDWQAKPVCLIEPGRLFCVMVKTDWVMFPASTVEVADRHSAHEVAGACHVKPLWAWEEKNINIVDGIRLTSTQDAINL